MRNFSVKDYCFSKLCTDGIVRFVRAKQRAKTPTRFRAGGFAAFSGNSDSISCRQHIFSDLISCNLWNAAPPSCADAAKIRPAFVQFGPPLSPGTADCKGNGSCKFRCVFVQLLFEKLRLNIVQPEKSRLDFVQSHLPPSGRISESFTNIPT